MWFTSPKKTTLPDAGAALPGRSQAIPTEENHFVNGRPLKGPYPDGMEIAAFGLGCFWGVERVFWQVPGVWVTAVGYTGGITPNPTYEETCTGQTGHNEAVLVVFDPATISYQALLRLFWESHDPTQGMRQGNDVGSQYRSGIYTYDDAQAAAAAASKSAYEASLQAAGYGLVTTEIVPAAEFYFAEDYHQQYLAKVPHGYCNMSGTGVACSIGTGVAAE